MNTSIKTPPSEAFLRTDLNELSHALLREMASACKKMGIYGEAHPLSRTAVEKPFMLMSRIFQVKKYININVQRGQLYILNIRLKENVFSEQMTQCLQFGDIRGVLFDRELSVDDFAFFIKRLSTRVSPGDTQARLATQLEDHKISTVQVNSEFCFDLFENQKQYRGDVDGDFSVRRFCLNLLEDNIKDLMELSNTEEANLLERFIDFDPSVVEYVLPEKIVTIPYEEIKRQLMAQAEEYNQAESEPEKAEALSILVSMIRLVDCHSEKDKIVKQFDEMIRKRIFPAEEVGDPASATGKIKIASRNRIDILSEELYSGNCGAEGVTEFAESFGRLLKTGQHDKAESVLKTMVERLSDPYPDYRQTALRVLLHAIEQFNTVTDKRVIRAMVQHVGGKLNDCQETFEYSEILAKLFEKCRMGRLYELMACMTENMAKRRFVENGVVIYDSMAVKKAFDDINRPEAVRSLVSHLIQADFDTSGYIRETLVAIGSEEIALELSEIISHESRQVRQQALRILAELGKSSLRVFSRILMDDSRFERETGRHELPDDKWYVLRNTIFVLGSLRDEEAIASLRLRISDTDVRIRREITAALEKIGGEEAVDTLILMADDPVLEIRDKAIILVGLIGRPDNVPLLIDVAQRHPAACIKVVTALAKLGGDDAVEFLSGLLTDDAALIELTGGKVAKDDLRLAVVNALGKIGDKKAIDSIREFKDSLSTTQKIFFKKSSVNKAISQILEKK